MYMTSCCCDVATRPEYVYDTMINKTDDTWSFTCDEFHLKGNSLNEDTVLDYNPETTAICR